MHTYLLRLSAVLIVWSSLIFTNSLFSQSFKDLSRQADSLYRAKGPSAAEPIHLKRIELALTLYGDTSAQHLRANYDVCRMQYEQMKLEDLPERFEYIESLIKKRNITLDPLLTGYYRVRLTHASFASDHAAGLVWAQKSLDLCNRLYGENAPRTLDAINNVAFSLIRNKQYVKAKTVFLDLKEKVDKYNSNDISAYVSLYFNLAEIHEFEGDFENAVKYFERTKHYLDQANQKAHSLQLQLRILVIKILHLNNTANIQQWLYEYLNASETVFGKNTHEYAKDQFHVAEILINQRIFKPAIQILKESSQSIKRINGENSVEYGFNLLALGNAYYKTNDIEEALLKHNQAYDILEKNRKRGDRDILFTLEQVIKDYQKLGDKRISDSLSNIYISKSGDFDGNYEDKLHVNITLARLYYELGKLDLSKQNALVYKTEVDSNQATFKYRKLLDYWSILPSVHHAAGNPEKAREAIINWMDVNDRDLSHRLFGISENDRLSFVQTLHGIHGYALSSFLKYGYKPNELAPLYNNILKYKSTVFQSAAIYQRAISNIRDSSAIQLVDQWQRSKRSLSHLSSLPQNTLKSYDFDLEKLTRETQILEGEIIEKIPEISQYLKIPDNTWQDVQQALSRQSAAIDIVRFYYRNEEKDPYDQIIYAVFIIKAGDSSPQLLFLENGNDINSFLYERYCNDIRAGKKVSDVIYQAFWSKIEPYLKGINTLYIAPDGIFHKINLSVLRMPNGGFLSEKYQINTLLNLSSIIRPQSASRVQANTACLIGDPRFDLNFTPPSDSNTTIRNRNFIPEQDLLDPGTALLPLPETALEVAEIGKLLKAKGYTVQTLLDTAATVTNVQKIQHPRILHVATHGYFLKSPKREKFLFNEDMVIDQPELRAMLFFAGASNTIQRTPAPESVGDGILTALEAENLDLANTELVVLSACDTGLGIIENGEGVAGLQRAFHAAGAKFILLSLWEIEDKESRRFMRDFYQNLIEKNKSIPDAFHATQLNMQKAGMDIKQWGAFVLVQD